MDRVAVISDPLTDMPQELAAAYHIKTLPRYINLDDKAHSATELLSQRTTSDYCYLWHLDNHDARLR